MSNKDNFEILLTKAVEAYFLKEIEKEKNLKLKKLKESKKIYTRKKD